MPEDRLSKISCPGDIKNLSPQELRELALEIRKEIVLSTSKTGGHLAPSLGVVELTLGIHRALNCPEDKIVFDVGHQSYVHKLLTGRCERFGTLRTYGGLSGFTKRCESEFDAHDSGHASDSISIATGLALARDARGGDEEILAVIGDGSMTGGMAFEAMNYLGQIKTNITIILNDNEMSISPNVGAIAGYLGRIRLDPAYMKLRDTVESVVTETGKIGRFMMSAGEAAKDSFKQLVIPGMFFEELGLKYVGPIDGHDIAAVQSAIEKAKQFNGPVIIHAVTKKGLGYAPAQEHPDSFHGVGKFDVKTGQILGSSPALTYTKVFSQTLIEEAKENGHIVAITAAMPAGTGLEAFAQEFPSRTYDVGIAEGHAVGMAAGLALGGQIPIVAIYSTFLQRAYDQVIINVALQQQHVVFCIDRAGLVGEDGPTHHGVFDISYLRTVPNMTILAPSSAQELANALHTAIEFGGPIAVRYPRGNASGDLNISERETWEYAKSVECRKGTVVEILAVGDMVAVALAAAELLEQHGISSGVRDMRWIKPLDTEAVLSAAREDKCIVTIEDGTVVGGFGSAVLDALQDANVGDADVLRLGVPDRFIQHGAMALLFEEIGLDARGVCNAIKGHISDSHSRLGSCTASENTASSEE